MKTELILEIKETTERDYDGFDIVTTDQVIQVLISNRSDCCEIWGHFVVNDDPKEFLGASLLGIELTDTALNTKILSKELEYGVDNGGIVFVNLKTNLGTLQFAVYNSHNGYYGHTVVIKSKQLNHEEDV